MKSDYFRATILIISFHANLMLSAQISSTLVKERVMECLEKVNQTYEGAEYQIILDYSSQIENKSYRSKTLMLKKDTICFISVEKVEKLLSPNLIVELHHEKKTISITYIDSLVYKNEQSKLKSNIVDLKDYSYIAELSKPDEHRFVFISISKGKKSLMYELLLSPNSEKLKQLNIMQNSDGYNHAFSIDFISYSNQIEKTKLDLINFDHYIDFTNNSPTPTNSFNDYEIFKYYK